MKCKICCHCNKNILNLNETNYIFGKYSHKKCDNKYFKKQEKEVKYIK